PRPSRAKLLPLLRAQPRQLALVDQLLPPPTVDRLIADLEQARHLSDRLPRRDQVERPPAKLSRIPLPCHERPPASSSRSPDSRTQPLRNRGYSKVSTEPGALQGVSERGPAPREARRADLVTPKEAQPHPQALARRQPRVHP